jgi:alpha-mannosidase
VYGSRPEIKIQHQQATRALLGAELYSVIADFLSVSGVASAQNSIATGWTKLTPSTHHDYITGTRQTASLPTSALGTRRS